MAAFTGSTASGSTLALASLDDWLPSSVTTTRVTATTCQVSWTPHGAAPVGATYDITDGSTTLASDVAGTTTVVTTGAAATTPVVKLRVGTWLSSSGTTAASACLGWPDAPALTLTPSHGQIAATWTAPAGNGGTVASYAASISPAGTGTTSCSVLVPAARSCVFTGLTDGLEYTVSVTATSSEGTGPAGTATAFPYPSTILTAGRLALWLDGADPSTLLASSSCSGAAATTTVGCWMDKSGNANHAVQSGGAQRPALGTVAGRPVPDLDGTDDFLTLDPALLPTGTTPSTILVDAELTDPDPGNSAHRMILTWGTNSAGRARGLWKGWYDDSVFASVWAGAGISTSHWAVGVPQVAVAEHATPAISVWADGDATGSTSSVDGPYTTGAANALLGQFEDTYFWQGPVPEVIVLTGTATSAERRALEEYLARKWGSTITPQAPTGVTISPTAAGTTADVSWTAPSWNGGSVVTGYTVTATPTSGGGAVTCTAVHPATSCTLSGLAGGGAQYSVTVAATNVAGTGPASTTSSLFAGLPVTAGLELWLDGADPTTLLASSGCSGAAATSAVGCWADKSGTGNHATQPNGARQPTLATVASRSVPGFDGANDYLSLDPALLPLGTASSTEFAVASTTDPSPASTSWSTVLEYGSAATGQARSLGKNKFSTSAYADTYNSGSVTGGSWDTGTTGVVGVEFASAQVRLAWAGGPYGAATSSAFNTAATSAVLGASSVDGPNFWRWEGPISEVLVFSSTLSPADQRSVAEYLARKWSGTITPAAPQSASATAGNATAMVSFTAPAWNGGSPITSYTVTPVGGPGSCTWSAGTSASCSGLTNGTSYTFTVAAVNGIGAGPVATTAAVMPAGAPGAPTGVAATADDTVSSVSWTAPASDGGSAVTSYTATAVPSDGTLPSRTCSAASSPCSLSGLTNGVTYTVSVTATNALGTGSASSSTSVIPYPKTIMTGASFKLWLDGADPATLYASSSCSGAGASSTVGCWKDKSGQANDAVQATGANQPALATVSGRSVPSFDGSTGTMTLTPGLLPAGASVSTTFVVGRMTDPTPATSGWRAALSWGTAVSGQTRTYEKNNVSAGAMVAAYQQAASSGGTWAAGTTGILADAWSSTAYTGYFNTVAGSTVTGSFSTGTSDARVGSQIGGSEYWLGQVPEVLVFGSTLSATDRRQVDEYLARKWGVTITPSAPVSPSASAGSATATVSWSAPAWSGGASVTSYTVSPVGGPGSCTWSSGTTASCTGLSNGTSYTFTVAAANSAGTGPTATTGSVTPIGVPAAPTGVAASVGDTTSDVSWTGPGGTVTGYTATAVPSDNTYPTRTCTSASSPCTVTGLTDGLTYTVTVTASNASGTGSPSASTSVIPVPALLSSANAQLWLDGKDVDGDGVSEGSTENCETATACVATGNVLTRWEDKSGRNHDGVQATGAMAGTYTPATGLVTFTANGYYQASSVAVGPDATAFAVASSATPTWNTYGWLMGGRAANGWVLHPNNGASNTHFMGMTSSGYNAQTTVTGDLTPVTAITNPHIWDGWITGSASQTLNHGVDGAIGSTVSSATTRAAGSVTLTIGADDFDLAARRGNGSFRELVAFDRALTAAERRSITEYLARKWSVAVTPSAPQAASATGGNATATVSWSAPAWNGGAGVSSYTVTPVGGAGSCTWSSGTTASCTGLTNGTPYTFTVAAVNSIGTGPTATTASVTPYTVPGAPTGVAATADDTVSSVSWTAPASNGGSAITSYTATAVPSDGTLPTRTCSSATSPCSLSGLTNGITYTISVTATNAAGAGSASSTTTVIPYPKTVMSGASFKLWLDGADSATLYASSTCSGAAATTTVGCWKDKSGTTNNATQATAANQPTLTTVNGRSVPGYDGSNDRLALTPSLLPTGSTSGTEFAAAATTEATPASSDYRVVLGYGTGATAQARLLGKYTFSTSAYADTWNSGSVTAGTWVNGTTSVLASEYASSQVRLAWAGGPYGSAAASSFATGTTAASVGSNLDSTNFWKGPISEVLVFSTTLSSADQRSVAEYLARKWGSTITPGAPVSPSASGSGTTATISWSAPTWNGGAAVSSYTVSTAGGKSCTTSGTSCQITGLVPDGTYTFTVSATNSVGTGPTSSTNATMPSPAQPIDTFELSVWGYGASGRTGVLMTAASTGTGAAVRMPGPETWASVSAGTDHTCGITTGGALYCWGNNANGELGVGDLTMRWEPAQVAAGTTWSSVSAGQDNTCAIKATDSSLWCWGYYGASNLTTPTAITTSGVTTWSKIAVGIQFACGLKTDSTLWCVGNGANGRLGNGSTSAQTSPVQVSVGSTFTDVTAGEQHACAIRASDSAALCWGYNGFGQLGNNAIVDSSTPVTVSGGLTWSSLSGGESMTCGLTTGSAIYCWGYNGFGQLGDNTITDRHLPTRESTSGTTWSTVSASFNYSVCATKNTGALSCWGYNAYGQLGDGSTTDRHAPTASGSATDWTSVSGGGYGTCGIRSDAGIWCQGYDGDGEFGHHYATAVGSPTPLVPFAGPWYSGSTAYEGGCGVRSDGTLWCWGVNTTGWHGTGNTTEHDSPVQAGSSTAWRTVSVGIRTACGIRDDGTLYCWGYATDGQTGVSGATGNVTTPTAGPSDLWSDVSVGETHTCGITTLGLLYCWGENSSGQLGQGDVTNRSTPVAVTATGVSTWTDVSAGYYSTCAIAATGANAGGLYCWGMNSSGQVGNGSTTVQKSPVQIGSATWLHVASGRQHTCGVRTNGTLWCWGINNLGQLGGGGAAGTPATVTSPQQVGVGTTWSTVGAGYEFSCATKNDGTLWCWGRNDVGQVGDRTTTTRTSPVQVSGWTGSLQEVHGSAMIVLAGS